MDIFVSTRQETASVGNTSVRICQPNPSRSIFSIRNTSTGGQDITLSFGNVSAVAGSGVILSAGQSYTESNGEGFDAWKGEIQAIASAVGGTVAIFER